MELGEVVELFCSVRGGTPTARVHGGMYTTHATIQYLDRSSVRELIDRSVSLPLWST